MRSTYLAPKAVLDLISASRLLGRYWNGPGSILRVSFESAVPGTPASAPMDATSPTWTPRNFTFAPFSMTRPARSETKVSGTVFRSVPENSRAVSVDSAATTTTSTGAHQIGSILSRRGALAIPITPKGGSCRNARRRTA